MKLKVLGIMMASAAVLVVWAATTKTEGWENLSVTRFTHELRPADVTVAEQELREIHKLFLSDPALSPTPSGLLVIPRGVIGYGPGSGMSASSFSFPRNLVAYQFNFSLLHPKQYCPNGGNCRVDIGEGPLLYVSVNTPAAAMYDKRPYRDKDSDKWYLAPAKIGEIAGFPLYENGRVVITKSQRPLWIPVSREEFVRTRINEWRGYPLQQKFEQELSSLTNPTGPAYCCSDRSQPPSGLAEAEKPGTHMVVRLNKDFFDPAIGAGTAQVITVDTAITIDRTLGKGHRDRPLIEEIMNKLDWRGLSGLVH